MENHDLGPADILQKHVDLKPIFAIAVSISNKNEITLDISHPLDLKNLAVLYLFIKTHIEKIFGRQTQTTAPPVPTPPSDSL